MRTFPLIHLSPHFLPIQNIQIQSLHLFQNKYILQNNHHLNFDSGYLFSKLSM